ncbi:MAG TPA: ribokinase [Opitutaceae bacterium]|nr:ribokinase [Opitutaceae bacterium]
MTSPTLVVIGSSNTDLVMEVPVLPRPGETVAGGTFRVGAGGKGANQAVAAARAGAAVRFVGRVGRDDYGRAARTGLLREGIDLTHLVEDPSHHSGVAVILVAADGTNSIAVAGGANLALDAEDVRRAGPAFAGTRVVLAQFETSPEPVEAAGRLAAANRATFILNPAPARPIAPGLAPLVSILTPNELEAETLTGVSVNDVAGAGRAAAALREQGFHCVVITLGARGALLAHAGAVVHVPGFAVDAVDTTAAGDVFNGALATALAEDRPLPEAVRFANAAAALAVTRRGAQESAPTRQAIDAFLARPPGSHAS